MFALKVALIASALLQLAVGQTLDVRLYRSDNCLIGTGMACHGVQSNQCCQDPNDNRPFSSARTENWNGIGPGTALKLYATQGGVKCALVLTRLTEAMNCLGNDWDEMITGAAFRNGVGAGEDTGCAAVHPADEYFYQPGDGYRFVTRSMNVTCSLRLLDIPSMRGIAPMPSSSHCSRSPRRQSKDISWIITRGKSLSMPRATRSMRSFRMASWPFVTSAASTFKYSLSRPCRHFCPS